MVAFLDAHRATYGVQSICAMLPIVPRIYYTHHGRAQALSRRPARQQRGEELAIEIRRVRNATFPVYGPRRMWQQLTQEGIRVARCTVERLMRALRACQVTVLGRALSSFARRGPLVFA